MGWEERGWEGSGRGGEGGEGRAMEWEEIGRADGMG